MSTRDEFDTIDEVEAAVTALFPTANAIGWQIRGPRAVLVVDLGDACVEVCPLPGERVQVSAVLPLDDLLRTSLALRPVRQRAPAPAPEEVPVPDAVDLEAAFALN